MVTSETEIKGNHGFTAILNFDFVFNIMLQTLSFVVYEQNYPTSNSIVIVKNCMI